MASPALLCARCQKIVKKVIHTRPGSIVGRYLCGCKDGPRFPLVVLRDGTQHKVLPE